MAAVVTAGLAGNQMVVDWKAHTDGAVASTGLAAKANAYNDRMSFNKDAFKGEIVAIETIPGNSGDLATNLPTDAYDVTINDAYGRDILDGTGANRSGTVAETIVFATPLPVDFDLNLVVAAAGSGGEGRIVITFK